MDEKQMANILSILMKSAGEIFDGLEGFRNGKLSVEADGEKEHLVIKITKSQESGLDMSISLRPLQASKQLTEPEHKETKTDITATQVIEQTEELTKGLSEQQEKDGEEKEEDVFFL